VTDDVLLTVLMVASALGLKSALGAVDLVPSISEWWAMRSLLGE
jgi:hypothetical protein